MSVFTVFFCGTGSNKFDPHNPNYWNGELVSTLANNMASREFADWIVIDGPGSGNLQADELFTAPGGYGMTGTLFGYGWEENVQHAMNIIKGHTTWQRTELTQKEHDRLTRAGVPIPPVEVSDAWFWRRYNYGKRNVTQQQLQEQIIKTFRKGGIIPKQVNLVGWSRGGISCHMLANAMLADPQLKHVQVNILALDPVPGLGNCQTHRITLGSNVKEYVAFYARDERSKGFACVIPHMAPSTAVHVFPMVGRHATLVGNAALDGIKGPTFVEQPGLVVRHYAERCLTRWGSVLNKMLKLTPAQINAYLKTIADRQVMYLDMRKHSYTKLTEHDGGERYVSLGEKGIKFSLVTGLNFKPDAGLAEPIAKSAEDYKYIS